MNGGAIAAVVIVAVIVVGGIGFFMMNDNGNTDNANDEPPSDNTGKKIKGEDFSLYTNGFATHQTDDLIGSYATPSGYIYVYKIATIENYMISPLTDNFRGTGDSFEITVGNSFITSTSITKSLKEAYSLTVSDRQQVSPKISIIKDKLEVGLEFEWSKSTTTSTEFTEEVRDEVIEEKNWSAKYIISNTDPNCMYRLAYVYSDVDVYEYIKKDAQTGQLSREYGIAYTGSSSIALQKTYTKAFDIPGEFKIQSSHTGYLPTGEFGTSSSPYRLLTEVDLGLMANNSSAYYVMLNDIKLTKNWKPFNFSGNLDGNDKTITGLTINETSDFGNIYTGLFAHNYGTIKNLTIKDAVIMLAPHNFGNTCIETAGIIAGDNRGTITNCTLNNCSITAYSTDIEKQWLDSGKTIPKERVGNDWERYASLSFTGTLCKEWKEGYSSTIKCGSICGYNNGTVNGCVIDNECKVLGKIINFNYRADKTYAHAYVGGVVGDNQGTVTNNSCSATVWGQLDLHHSGDGTGKGLGYVGDYCPYAELYYGEICGYGKIGGQNSFRGTITQNCLIYAPGYSLFSGANYNEYNKGLLNNITVNKNM